MPNITQFFFEALFRTYTLTGNLGLALILLTIVIRFILLPLTLPSIKAQKKIKDIQPELKKLKALHGKDKKAYQLAQVELYKKYNINPLAGCLPQILQLVVLIFLYRALLQFFGQTEIHGVPIIPTFLGLDLTKADPTHILPIVAGITQFVLSLMILPATEVRDIVPNDSTVPAIKKENEKEEDMAEMAASMQQQMVFMMPIMSVFVAWSFPAGLGLYWVVTTVFSIVQQWILSGPGGLVSYSQRAINWVSVKLGRTPVFTSTPVSKVENSSTLAPVKSPSKNNKKNRPPARAKKTRRSRAK